MALERHLPALAAAEKMTTETFVNQAATEKVQRLLSNHLHRRAELADPAALQAVLDRVVKRPPLPSDE